MKHTDNFYMHNNTRVDYILWENDVQSSTIWMLFTIPKKKALALRFRLLLDSPARPKQRFNKRAFHRGVNVWMDDLYKHCKEVFGVHGGGGRK